MRSYTKANLLRNKMVGKVFCLMVVACLGGGKSWGQTAYTMSSGNKTWDLSGTWTVSGNTYTGTDAGNWGSVGVIGSGSSVTTGTRTTKSSATIVTGVNGGFQKPSGTIQFLSTGSSATPEAVAIDLLLDFTGRTAGTLSFDWAAIDNPTGTRPTSLRVFWSTDGTTFTEITGAQLLDKESATSPASGSISSIALPIQFSGSSTARLRFYNHAGTTATGSGNRDKFQIDNIGVTSTASLAAPTVTSSAANSITTTGATLNGTVSSNGAATTVTFNYGTTVSYGTDATAAQSPLASNASGTSVTAAISSLSVNTQYNFRASGNNTQGTTNGSNLTFYTLANTPNAPTVNNATASTLDVAIGGSDGNPSATEYAIQETGSTNYVQANGSLGASAVWQTASSWGTKTVTGLASSTGYTFKVKARNGANTETAFGSTASGTTTAAATPILGVTGTTSHGSVCPNISATPIQYTITNTGSTASNVVVSSSDPQFVVNGLSSTTIAATNGTATYNVTFTPTSAGAKTATISVFYNTNSLATTSSLTGTGLTPVTAAITSSAATLVVNTTATLNGSVTTLGVCPATTEKGFVYSLTSTNSNPQDGGTGVTKTSVAGLTTGAFTLGLTSLTPNTSYSFNSYVFDGTSYTYGTVRTFTTLSVATKLVFGTVPPTTANVATNLTTFTVQAQRADNSVDVEYTASITLARNIVSGSATLSGTSASAVAGVATFSTTQFSAAGTYTITASSAALTTVTSSNIVVSSTPVTILTFDFGGLNGDEVSSSSNFNIANTSSSTITRGNGLTPTANADRFNAQNWSVTSIADAVSGNDFMEFTVTPNVGYQFSVSSIQFQIQRSASGLTQIALRNSLDNYGSNLDAVKSVVDNTSTQSFTFTFTQVNSGAAVTYRLYGYGEAAGGSAGIGDFAGNDIVVTGNVSIAPLITLSNTNLSQIGTQNITRNTINTPISRFQVDVTTGDVTLSSLSFVTPNNATTNSYVNTDISNFKLYYTTGTTFNTSTVVGGANTQSSGKGTTNTGETITFSGLTQTLAIGTYYLWVTGDILGTATPGRTLTVNAPTITTSVGSLTGSTTATGTQTIIAATPTNYFLVANNGGVASNWNTVADGSGAALSTLSSPTDVNLIVDNATAAFFAADISLGNNSKIIISQGSTAKLTLNGCTVTATIDVGTAGTLEFFNTATQQASTTIGTLASGSTVEYSNTADQTIPRTVNFSNLTISGAATKTAAAGGAIQVANNLTINNSGIFVLNGTNNLALAGTLTVATGATFDNGGESQITNSGGSINISGTFITRDAQGFTGTNSAIPTITPVLNTGSTVEYGLGGAQTITDFAYKNLTFSNSGTKSTTGAVSSIAGTVTIKDAAIVNVSNNTFGGSGTNLTINGTGRLINGGSGTKPDISGTYTLATTSTIEFSGSSATIIRSSTSYGNIDISGTNVSLSGTGTSITLQSGSTFTVKSTGTFNVKNTNGLSGASNTAISNTNSPSITLETGSTVNYNDVAQPITSGLTYSNITLAGSGIKTASATFIVNGTLTLTGTASLGTTSPTYGSSGTLAYVNATNGTTYTEALEWPTTSAPANVTLNLSGTGSPSLTITSSKTISGALTLTAGTFNINGQTLTLNGTLTGSGLLKGSSTSSIIIGGTGALGTLNFDQTTDGTTNVLSNLTYSKAGGFSLGNKLVLIDIITPTAGTLTTGGFLHLRSTSSNTARIAAGSSSGGYITGNVTVERYLSASGNRAYRLLTPSVNTSTNINSNWQEGLSNSSSNTNLPSATAGYGTHITGTGGSSNGFDATFTNQASLYIYNPSTPSWDAVGNTNVNTLSANTGYLLYIRGNRDALNVLQSASPSSDVVLRATGTLPQGDTTFTGLLGNGAFNLVTNRFASPILWDASTGIYSVMGNANSFENAINIWDPNVGTRGGYVTIQTDGTITGGGNLTREIQSGQAFFVQTKTGVNSPTLSLLESHKSTTNNLNVFRSGTQTETLKTLLYYTDNSGTERNADGVTCKFNNNYSNNVDGDDAEQIDNWDEDVSINRGNKLLSIEARNLADANDTIPLAIARLKTQAYKWKLVPQNINAPGIIAQLRDNFTNTNTAISLSDTTVISFAATADPASKAANRFSIVFKQNGIVPITISSIKAYTKGNAVQVEWSTKNETNIDRYEVEKSEDGTHFYKIAIQPATGSTTYIGMDANPIKGNNFYRVKLIEKTGKESYSEVVKVAIGIAASFVSIYPNPATSNQLGLQLNNLAKGSYSISIINSAGQKIYTKTLQHNGGSSAEQLLLNGAFSAGTYQLIVEGEGQRFVQEILRN